MTDTHASQPFVSYLAHAAVSPPSEALRKAVDDTLSRYSKLGSDAFPLLAAEREVLRENLATLIGCSAKDVAFVPSTTRGIVDVALSLKWRRGDRVVLFSGEFPGNVTPWQRAAATFGLEVSMLSLDGLENESEPFLDALETTLRCGARLVAVSAVQFQTGLRMPLAQMSALCHAHGAELFVDAIQACGVVPLDVRSLGIDYLACGAHKWLMGLEGAGFVYVAPERASSLEPRTAGWLSHEDPVRFLMGSAGELRYDRPLKHSIQFLEGGSINALGFAALNATVPPLLERGVDAIFLAVSQFLDDLEAGLQQRGVRSRRPRESFRRSGILSIEPPDGLPAAEIARGLKQRGVIVSTPDGLVRFAPHFRNSLDEVPAVLDAFDSTLAELRRQGP